MQFTSNQALQSRPADDLVAEAECYLALVEVFRAEGCEPDWQAEPGFALPRARYGPSEAFVLRPVERRGR